MMSQSVFIKIYENAPSLAREVARFNFCPAEYLHRSKRGQFCSGLEDASIWNTPQALRPISAFILACLKIEDKPCFDITHIEWPLALLNAIQLERLERYISAALFAPLVKKSLSQADVTYWRMKLGHDGYKFALTGTSLLPSFGFDASTLGISHSTAISSGWIEAALSTAPDSIRLRANLKLPSHTILPLVDAKDAQRLVNSLLSILESKWRSCFITICD